MTGPDQAFVLSIGSIAGGWSEATAAWDDAIRELAVSVANLRHGVMAPLNLNVVYHIPGHLLSPDFEGVRTGRFRRRDTHLMVQVAVPPGVPRDARAFVAQALLDAVDEAERSAVRRRIADSLEPIRDLARRATRHSAITNPEPVETVTLYRPTGPKELELVERSGWKAWPPRLPEQPIFYPVLDEDYARKIARDWNATKESTGYHGYVTRFNVRSDFLAGHEIQTVGASWAREYWIPAGELEDLNAAIVGQIEVVAAYVGGPGQLPVDMLSSRDKLLSSQAPKDRA